MDDLDKFPSQLAERFQVRLPDGMRDRLKAAAEANNRSMNAEIVARLANSFADDDGGSLPKVGFEIIQPVAAAVAEQTVVRIMDVWLEAFQGTGGRDTPSVERLREYLNNLKGNSSETAADPGPVIRRINERDSRAYRAQQATDPAVDAPASESNAPTPRRSRRD